jgi:ATP-binding cassette subfamily C protein LapB
VQTLARAHQARAAFKTLDAMMAAPTDGGTPGGGRPARSGPIEFRKVSFTYPGATAPALSEVSLRIAQGERVGLIGRIGSGKSTVGRLLAGFYEPSSGEVLIDGIDIRQFAGADLRSVVGLVLQEPELFSGTLRDNIVIGQPRASAEEIERVVKLAGVDGFAARHPLGLAMPIAERGRSLSGGQKQSIAVARSILRKPRILFLDEPTSAADTSSERQLVANLKAGLPADTTIIVSTHRDGMPDLVDRLVVFDNGRVMLDGPKADVVRQLREAAQAGSGPRPPRPREVTG